MGVLNEFDQKSHNILLDGEFRRSESGETLNVIDPATEDVIAEIAETSAAEVDAAVDAGHAASRKWWRISALERSEIMHEIANDLLAMKHELAEALTREMGKPYKESAKYNTYVSAVVNSINHEAGVVDLTLSAKLVHLGTEKYLQIKPSRIELRGDHFADMRLPKPRSKR